MAMKRGRQRHTVAPEPLMAEYRRRLQSFRLEELLWDLGCNVPPYIREELELELSRRGLTEQQARKIHGRGQCRPPESRR